MCTSRIVPSLRATCMRGAQITLAALHAFAPERLRDGAMQWDVFEDAALPGRFVEMFLLPSWDDHLRQHARVSHADAELQRVLQGFHHGPQAPKVEHWIGQRRGLV